MERNNLSFEPMDIDLSSQSVKGMDISYSDDINDLNTSSNRASAASVPASTDTDKNPSPKKSPVKNRRFKRYHIKKQKPQRGYKKIFFKILASVVIIFVSIISYNIFSLNCCDKINIELFSEKITNNLFGQTAAVKLFINSLDVEVKSKILFLYGGTGVGKTYSSSLLLDSMGPCSNVYHYTMPTFKNTFSTDLMFGLTLCKMSLIIVDDLTIRDMDIKVHINSLIEKSESVGKEITVILIFNCNDEKHFENSCDESFERKLVDNFSEIKAVKRFIQFEPLSEIHLRKCIKQELKNRGLDDLELQDLLKNFNVSVDGCKGVHSKVKYLNIG